MVNRAQRPAGDARKRVVTGVAISSTELCAADLRLRGDADRAWRATLDPPPVEGAAWPSLASALRDLARAIGADSSGGAGTLAVALMPPLTEMRRLELPPLNDEELHRVLAQHASRYFVAARGSQIVGAMRAGKTGRGAPGPVIAASASARLVASIHAAAEEAGWEVRSVAPAESAWAGAWPVLWPALARQDAWLAVAHEDRTDLLELSQGRLVGVRRFRSGATDAAMIAETAGRGARVAVAGAAGKRRDLAASLAENGITVSVPSGEWQNTAADPALLAAHFAGREAGPVLRGGEAVATAAEEDRRLLWKVIGAAAALVVLAAGAELWGVHRELGLVRAERERLRPQIAASLVGRTTVDEASRHLASLNTIDRTMPQWSAVIAMLSHTVPDDAYLTALRARGDSLVVDGLADHASRVFDALQQSKMLIDVRSAAPVRRELQEDGTALDHFTIAARIAPVDRPPAAAPASTVVPRTGR